MLDVSLCFHPPAIKVPTHTPSWLLFAAQLSTNIGAKVMARNAIFGSVLS